jgi:hypothetical protein
VDEAHGARLVAAAGLVGTSARRRRALKARRFGADWTGGPWPGQGAASPAAPSSALALSQAGAATPPLQPIRTSV